MYLLDETGREKWKCEGGETRGGGEAEGTRARCIEKRGDRRRTRGDFRTCSTEPEACRSHRSSIVTQSFKESRNLCKPDVISI